MNRTDLIAAVSARSGYAKVDVTKIFGALIRSIEEALKEGERVNIRNFGALEIRSRKERVGRNPTTGENLTVRANNRVVFVNSQIVKDLVNLELS